MDSIDRINKAIDYIEENLCFDISYEEISKITLSHVSSFQKFFYLATGITVAEYIRWRKLSSALNDLQNTDSKIIDIALKYGYESPEAFSVAFKRLYEITPSQARITDKKLKRYNRVYFTLTVSYLKGENEMLLLNVDKCRYYDPLFESARVILTHMGEKYSAEYIQGISGAAFKIAGGCPSRPTCVTDFWTTDFIRYLGYEISEYPCFDKDGNDISQKMIDAVKKHIDNGKPALVWNAFNNSEWDIVFGYDNEAQQFIGRGGSFRGRDDYSRQPWNRAAYECNGEFGAVLIGEKKTSLDERAAVINSIVKAVEHARKDSDTEGIQFYHKWAEGYSNEGCERGVADAYCYDIYSSVREAAVIYLRTVSYEFGGGALENMQMAANCFEKEVAELKKAFPYISWSSPWGVDEERSKNLAPILKSAAEHYEKGIEYLEKALKPLVGSRGD